MNRILVMEDDISIKKELYVLLRANGYQPIDSMPCELALLDINMNGESGYEVCRRIRQTSNIPIIFLTARDTPEDELLGFAVGADDYIKKPYNSAVLLARIASHFKRQNMDSLSSHGITLNLTSLTVCSDNKSTTLTRNEARILACLMKKELCSRNEIIEDLWNNSLYIDENTLYVNINRLRDKLKDIGMGHLITTVRGVGYRL